MFGVSVHVGVQLAHSGSDDPVPPLAVPILGADVVDWLYTHVEGFKDRREARKYASSMLKHGYLRHTVNKITFSEQCYYVFGDLCGSKSPPGKGRAVPGSLLCLKDAQRVPSCVLTMKNFVRENFHEGGRALGALGGGGVSLEIIPNPAGHVPVSPAPGLDGGVGQGDLQRSLLTLTVLGFCGVSRGVSQDRSLP